MRTEVSLVGGCSLLLLVLIVVAVLAIAYAIYSYVRMNRQMKKLDEMLDKAIDGSFTESCFDESQLSYLENKMWKYLSLSEISAKKTAAEKAKIKTLIADISHQTKTPVSNILLYAELLAECDLSDMEKEYANRIFSQSEKLSFLITSLVKMSRLETGIIALSPKETAFAPMLQDIVVQAQAKADEKGLKLTLECHDEKAVFDEKWTNEAVWNIVDNALKYTDKGSLKITVKEYEMFVCIEISDTGRGIPEDEQAQIFSRFYRSESTVSEEGIGIGLYLARQIVSAENGYIKVTSEIGKGSTFSVFLSKL